MTSTQKSMADRRHQTPSGLLQVEKLAEKQQRQRELKDALQIRGFDVKPMIAAGVLHVIKYIKKTARQGCHNASALVRMLSLNEEVLQALSLELPNRLVRGKSRF